MATSTSRAARPSRQAQRTSPRAPARRSPTRTCTSAGSTATGGPRRSTSPRTAAGWESLEDPAHVGAVDLLDVLLRRGLGHRHALPVHRRRAKEEQKYFLATQQVDEARHRRLLPPLLQGGDRRRRHDPATLAFTEPQLNWGYRGVFGRLDRMAEELRSDRSLPKFAQAIALYHLVVEASMAQPGQHFIEDYFAKAGTMPGFTEGMDNVSRDEQRHIGFGVKVLSELLAESDECKAAVTSCCARCCPTRRGLRAAELGRPRVHPRATASRWRTSSPSGCARSGRSGARSATRSRRCPPASSRSTPRCRTGGGRRAPDQAARRPASWASPAPDTATSEVQQIYFDVVAARRARSADGSARSSGASPTPSPGTSSSTTARPPRRARPCPDADLTLEATWADWIEVSMRGRHIRGRAAAPAAPARLAAPAAAHGTIWEPRRTG